MEETRRNGRDADSLHLKSVDLMKSRSTRPGRAGAAGISKMTTVIRLKQASRVRPLEGGREGGAIGESLEDDLNESTLRSGFS
jgi:hypothetical protein